MKKLLILILILVGAYFIFIKNYCTTDPVEVSGSQSCKTLFKKSIELLRNTTIYSFITPKGSKINETADWKTYQNKKIGYQIQFPVDSTLKIFDLEFIPENERTVDVIPDDTSAGVRITNGPVNVILCADYGVVYGRGCGTMGGIGIGTSITEETIIIDGREYKTHVIFSNDELVTNKLVSINLSPNLEIRYSFGSEFKQPFNSEQITEYDNLSRKIISTFKFIK